MARLLGRARSRCSGPPGPKRSMGETLMPAAIAYHAGAGMGGLAAAKASRPISKRSQCSIAMRCRRDRKSVRHRRGTPMRFSPEASERSRRCFPASEATSRRRRHQRTGGTRDPGRATRVRSLPAARPWLRRFLPVPAFCSRATARDAFGTSRTSRTSNFVGGSRATELIPSPDGRDAVAVRFDDDEGNSQVLSAELVVDASGMPWRRL